MARDERKRIRKRAAALLARWLDAMKILMHEQERQAAIARPIKMIVTQFPVRFPNALEFSMGV